MNKAAAKEGFEEKAEDFGNIDKRIVDFSTICLKIRFIKFRYSLFLWLHSKIHIPPSLGAYCEKQAEGGAFFVLGSNFLFTDMAFKLSVNL